MHTPRYSRFHSTPSARRARCFQRCVLQTAGLLLLAGKLAGGGTAGEIAELRYGEPRQVGTLQEPAIRESSGIAPSRIHPDVWWTHNDSGDGPRLFAFDGQGRTLGQFPVPGATAWDWEDMCSFERNGQSYLLIADVGNNLGLRSEGQLYLVREPASLSDPLQLAATIRFRYEDGAHNCEAVAVDTAAQRIYLVSKLAPLQSKIYELPLPDKSPPEIAKARVVAPCPLPWPTAMDISPDGRRAVILTYADAYEYHRSPDETWGRAFSRPGRQLTMPLRLQGETICYGPEGRSLYLTSERTPVPFWCVPCEAEPLRRGASPEGEK